MKRTKNIGWWYWLATASALTAGVLGWHWGFCIAGTLTVIQIVHFRIRTGAFASFPVQIRLAYLGVLLAAAPPALQWMYWVPAIGTWALVLFGYCLIARVLSLMPWNREGALTFRRVIHTFTARRQSGNVMHGLADAQAGCGGACALEFQIAGDYVERQEAARW